MALDPNIGRIKFLRTTTIGRKPSTNDIQEGELALNLTDRTIFSRRGDNIVDLGFGRGGKVEGNIAASGTVKATKLEGPLTGNADSATKLQTARAINGVSFDGTANITVPIKTIRTTAIETDDLSESVFFRSDAGAGTIGIHIQNPVDSRWAYQLSQDSSYNSIGLKVRVKSGGTWSGYKSLAFTDSDITGNAASATKLQTVRTLSWTGDATGSLTFDGTANVSSALTLANSGVAAGTYKSVTVDTKGRVTAGTNVITGLVTSTAASGTTNAATSNTNTYLNIVETIGSAATTVGTSTQVTGAGTVTVTSDTAGKLTITGSQTITGNAATATKLQTSRSINDVPFDGTFDIKTGLGHRGTISNKEQLDAAVLDGKYMVSNYSIDGMYSYGVLIVTTVSSGVINQTYYSHNVAGANAISQASRQTWNGINWGSWNMLGSLDSTKLPLSGGTISGSLQVDGTANVNGNLVSNNQIKGMYVSATGLQNIEPSEQGSYLSWNKEPGQGRTDFINHKGGGVGGFDWWNGAPGSYTKVMTLSPAGELTATGGFKGNASTATKLATTRTINGVAFDGTTNITIADSTKLPTAGGTVTGALAINGLLTANGGFKGHYIASDVRDLKPNATPRGSFGAYFTSQGGLTGAGDATYGDLLMLNSYHDTSGGNANALFFSKGGKSIFHYQAAQGATSWGSASQLAYVTDNVASATKLQTARTINGVAFDGSANITVEDFTKLPTAGGTITGALTVNGDLIVNQNETVKGNLTVEGLTADRFGLHDKMHWVGAYVQPYGTSVLNASVTTNTFQVIIRGESGAKYWTKGRTKLHFIINHGAPQNVRFVTATVTDWSTTDRNKQTITATLSLVNHAMPLNTVFHWVGSTYESFGCDWAGWMNTVGLSRWVMRLKPTTPLKSLAPIITSSCSSEVYWNASHLSQPEVEPQPRHEAGTIVINSVHNGDVVFAIGDNNNEGSASNEYVSISVKDFV